MKPATKIASLAIAFTALLIITMVFGTSRLEALPPPLPPLRIAEYAEKKPITPHPDRAVIVFVRPSNWDGFLATVILDARGGIVGSANGMQHFVIAVKPGKHTFVTAWYNSKKLKVKHAHDSHAFRGEFLAGKIYAIEIATNPYGMELFGIKRGMENFPKYKTWMAETRRIKGIRSVLDEMASLNKDRIREIVEEAVEEWEGFRPKVKERNSLKPGEHLPD